MNKSPQTSSDEPGFDKGCLVCLLITLWLFVAAECVFTVLVAGN